VPASSSSFSPLSSFNSFYLLNAAKFSRVESTLRSLTYFVPGQTLSSESLYTALNLLSLYHDALLSGSTSRSSSHPACASSSSSSSSATPPLPTSTSLTLPVSAHARYTKWWIRQSRLYKTVARLLSVIGYVQLVCEMAGKKYRGERGRWRVVIGLESVKAILRLILLRLTASRTILQPSIPEREVDPSVLAEAEASKSSSASSHSTKPSAASDLTWKATRTGIEIPTISSLRSSVQDGATGGVLRIESEINSFLQKKVLTLDNVRKPYDLVRKRRGLGLIAEVVWILRPLIYVLALRKFGRRHLYPFLLSLALEYFSYKNMSDSVNGSSSDRSRSRLGPASRQGPTSEVERQELSKRRKAFWLYFLRGPLWYGWTREKLQGFSSRFEGNRFGLGLVANILEDYKGLIDQYHYYSST